MRCMFWMWVGMFYVVVGANAVAAAEEDPTDHHRWSSICKVFWESVSDTGPRLSPEKLDTLAARFRAMNPEALEKLFPDFGEVFEFSTEEAHKRSMSDWPSAAFVLSERLSRMPGPCRKALIENLRERRELCPLAAIVQIIDDQIKPKVGV